MLRHKRGQSLVIIALSATALFGIIALGLDAGRLYFERRDVQNAADAAALAGAQELLPKTQTTIVTSAMAASARYYAATYAFKTWSDSPVDGSGSGNYTVNSGTPMTERARSVPAYAIITTASRGRQNEIEVEVHYQMPLTFAAMIGFTSSDVAAVAYAHGGFWNKQYTIFGMDAPGSGN
ncbi:MAG TPA: pilus assembly protein TadG-related protein, partial [Candidatus Eisenbacteria bacterium]|nr:pilus assembly protein TadG-related protein [Candidatus Eisenbacteria bacterium]